jgi:hypothetical protein
MTPPQDVPTDAVLVEQAERFLQQGEPPAEP